MDYLKYTLTFMVSLFYSTYSSVDFADHDIFRAEIGKGGIIETNDN